MHLTDYPTLLIAFELMLMDNVAIPLIINHIREKAYKIPLIPEEDFTSAEAELFLLDYDQLFEVCCGEDIPGQVSDATEACLTKLFEMIGL